MVLRSLIILAILWVPVTGFPVTVNDDAPDWSLQNAGGETVNYHEDSDKKVSMVLFWATWCPYCKSLMPHLEIIYRKYRSKGLKFYAINVFEDGDAVEYFNRYKFSSTLVLNGDEVAEQWGVKGTPALYVIGKDKKVIYKRPKGVSDVMVKQNIDLKIKYALRK
ncbi:MAG: TlpA family protein disulfide reductase [Thiotrichales bacterium]|nr:TlpA family protein disulfide reductase [Thiotrichales bacterium]